MPNLIYYRLYSGGADVAQTKRIMISLEHIAQEVDGIVSREKINRSHLIRGHVFLH